MTFHPYYIVPVIFWVLVLLFNRREIVFAQTLSSPDKKYLVWTQAVIFVGILLRTVAPASFPAGVSIDEAISGYDSWCLSNYGVDQHLSSYPVYLRSWGSGMNALYAYLGIPFIKLFGLSTGVYRLPMMLISCVSILVFYYTFRKYSKDYLTIFIVGLLFFLNPWHIMKSRWALESNLAPDLILLGLSSVVAGYHSLKKKKQTVYYAAGGIFFILAAYGYAVSWLMLPFFLLFLGIFLYRRKKIKAYQTGICLAVMIVPVVPLALFAINLFFGGEAYQIGALTITQLKESRHVETTLLANNSFPDIMLFIKKAFMLMLLGDDGLVYNGLRWYIGQFYNLLGLPFFAVAYIRLIKTRNFTLFDWLFTLWLVATLPVVLVVWPVVNHWNLLWFPVIYFVARGLIFCIEKIKQTLIATITVTGVLTVVFMVKYISVFNEKHPANNGFVRGIEQTVRVATQKDFDRVYFPEDVIHVTPLFYAPISPYVFDKTKEIKDVEMPPEHMKKYSNNYFYLPEKIEPLPRTAYIIPNRDLEKYQIEPNRFHVKKDIHYTLFWTD
jgi:hypothetical protein